MRLFLLLTLLPSLASAAELVVPEQFDLLKVNGVDSTTYFQRIKNVPLNIGHNEIEMEFNQLYEAEFGDSHDRIRSKPFTVMVDVKDEQEIWTMRAQSPKSRRDAVAYIKNPVYTLQNNSGENKTVSVATTMPKVIPQKAVPVINHDKPSGSTPPTVDVTQMLNYWWQLASPEQKQAFLQSIQEQ